MSPLLSNVTYRDRRKSDMQLRLPFLSNAILNTVSGFSVHVMFASSHRSLIRESAQCSIVETGASFSKTQYTLHEHQMYDNIWFNDKFAGLIVFSSHDLDAGVLASTHVTRCVSMK